MGWAALAGPALGAATGALFGGNKKTGYQQKQINQFTPEQQQLFGQLFSHVSPDSQLAQLAGGDQSQFDQLEAPAMRQFGQLQGQLASRFSGLGGAGALSSRRSSGFTNSMNQATSDFAQDLASRRMALQRQALQDLFGLSSTLLGQRPFENYLQAPRQSFGQSILGGLAPSLGEQFGRGFGGLFGG